MGLQRRRLSSVGEAPALRLVQRLEIMRLMPLLLVLGGPGADAATHYLELKSFGVPDQVGNNSLAELIQSGDGALYGTTHNGGPDDSGTVFKIKSDGSGYRTLHVFHGAANPASALVEGNDGSLYGTMSAGGANNAGALFKMNKDGTYYHLLHSFSTNGMDGQNPMGALIIDSDGMLYGTTYLGGTNGMGSIFKLTQDGTIYFILHSFTTNMGDGRNPGAGLMMDSNGALYGTTTSGGSEGQGTIYTLSENGTGYLVLHSFSSNGIDGRNPGCTILRGSDGALYGTTQGGGTNGAGTVFKLNQDGSGYTVVHNFGSGSGDAQSPVGRLVVGSDGALYGCCLNGGSNYYGTIFKLNKDGTGYTVLHSFGTTASDVFPPGAGLVLGSDGALYGTTKSSGSGGGTIVKLGQDGSSYAVLHSFLPGRAGGEGANPVSELLEGSDGSLYGTTGAGGIIDVGTVFKLNKDGAGYVRLHDFGNGVGWGPRARLLEGSDGALYGTTRMTDSWFYGNAGVVFGLNKDGSGYRVVIDLRGTRGGYDPEAGLVEGSDGTLYGTTAGIPTFGNGTVFKVNKDGSGLLDLHDFGPPIPSDGLDCLADLVECSDGALYGTTTGGGTNYAGTVFKINPDGSGYSILLSFGNSPNDARNPRAGLLRGSSRALYGTTYAGGNNNAGTAFKLNEDGTGYAILHSFSTNGIDGQNPSGRLLMGAYETLYGTTYAGGSNNLGTVFRMRNDGTDFSIVYSFGTDANGGQRASAGLIRGSDGAFYGTTSEGGELGFGTVFKLWPPETPDILSINIGTNVQVIFAGTSGHNYQLMRSTDLTNWTSLATILMPLSGSYTNLDNTPPFPAAFYRADWVP